MPTYVVSIPPQSLTDVQKGDVAKAISGRHHEATGAPPYFVQVIIEDRVHSTSYLGGERTDDAIWVRGDIRAGRTEEARTQLMLAIMGDIAEIASISKERV